MVRLCRCGNPLSKSGCRACARKKEDRRRRKQVAETRRVAQGLCVRCPAARVTARRCFDCWLRAKAEKYFGNPGAGRLLKAAWERQGGRCVYTGEALVPGPRASLDHIQPASRGGTNAPANLQWCATAVNIAKSALNHEEFVALCNKVSRRFPRKHAAQPTL